MQKVLMGDFDALYRLGFVEILGNQEIELVETLASGVLERLVQVLPAVVLLDQDKPETDELVRMIVRDFPAIRVIACSSERPTMRIFPSFHRGESYTMPLEPAEFELEVRG